MKHPETCRRCGQEVEEIVEPSCYYSDSEQQWYPDEILTGEYPELCEDCELDLESLMDTEEVAA